MEASIVFDLTPATNALTAVVEAIRDDQLDLPTPCEGATVEGILAHVDGLSWIFAAAAHEDRPDGGDQAPGVGGARLEPDWRVRVPRQLTDLADAWRDAGAWQGVTRAGGVDLPREVAGLVATNEVIVHGWDLAVATGQRFEADPALVGAALGFVTPAVDHAPEGTPGLFGAAVVVPDDASPLDALLGLTGRNPGWHPVA